jgi:hypothetical protein
MDIEYFLKLLVLCFNCFKIERDYSIMFYRLKKQEQKSSSNNTRIISELRRDSEVGLPLTRSVIQSPRACHIQIEENPIPESE